MAKLFDSTNVKVRLTGTSKAVTIPTEWCQMLNLEQGDYVKLELSKNKSEIKLTI